jgi:hypothetical protein
MVRDNVVPDLDIGGTLCGRPGTPTAAKRMNVDSITIMMTLFLGL